jgi:acetoin utilization deacetylase AcuC-like enzyme
LASETADLESRILSHDRSVPLTLFTSPRFADHLTPPGHPERVERFGVMLQVASEFRQQGGEVLEPRPAGDEELTRVHDAEYVGLLRETAGRAVMLDADTFTSPDSYEVACLAAGAGVSAVEHVLQGGDDARALALVRPPGHHAERNRAMGFCLFNTVAIAAAHARARGLSRVAIVDYDVHHGNGTQRSFYEDPSVLFISSHQYPYYPGTGGPGEIGAAAGEGFTVNLPLAAGATDADYERVYSAVAWPILRQFKPELILLSAGFDAYEDDPLGGMRVSDEGFERLTAALVAVARETCSGRVVGVVEGGYDLDGLRDCLRAAVRALAAPPPQAATTTGDQSRAAASSEPTLRADATLAAVRPRLAPYWTL